MGIRGLTAWLKKAHPDAIKQFPYRWASEEIRGKTVAIDATLLTNRYHFAVRDGPMEEKSAVTGWFHTFLLNSKIELMRSLITTMRQHGMKPIAVWDERGVRDWKAPEARKRLATRALNLSRLNHEEERTQRLIRLRTAVESVATLDLDKRLAIKTRWEETLFADKSLREMAVVDDSYRKLSDATAVEADPVQISILQLAQAVQDYRASSKPFARTKTRDPAAILAAALAHVKLDSHTPPSEPVGDIIDTAALDYAIQETATPYTESPLQTALTGAEGEIINRFLSEEIIKTPMAALKEIDGLMGEAPSIKSIYERALAVPTVETHEDCQELLRVMGVPVVEAKIPYEAEGVAASMAVQDLADFVGTEDSDVLAYGAPLLRQLTSGNKPLELIEGGRLPETIGLSQEAYLDFLILLGTDASPRIPGFGPIRALQAIRTHGSIENIVANDPKAHVAVGGSALFFELVENSRRVFGTLPPVPSREELEVEETDVETVIAFLRERHGIVIEEASEDPWEATRKPPF